MGEAKWSMFDGWPPTVLDEHGTVILSAMMHRLDQVCELDMAEMHRLVDDHNALSGITNVEALGEALQAGREMSAWVSRYLRASAPHSMEVARSVDLFDEAMANLYGGWDNYETLDAAALYAPQADPTGGFTVTGGRVGPDGLPPQASEAKPL